MDKMLMLGSCKAGNELLYEAKKRGIHTILADRYTQDQVKFNVEADEFWHIDTSDIDELEKRCRAEEVTAVINGISTFNTASTMELCRRLGLPCCCSPDAWSYTINKEKFKNLCEKNGVPVAKAYHISNQPTREELERIEYPVVVKAIDQSANRGMSYCFSADEIVPAMEYARSLSGNETVIIEKMLSGTEYGAWYAMADGEARLFGFVSMLHQPEEPNNCYSVTTTVADHLDLYLKEIDPYFCQALKEGNMNEGIAWIELILDQDGHFYVLEMGYRLAGDMMAGPLKEITHFDSYSWLIDIAAGFRHKPQDLPKKQTQMYDRAGCSYILWSKDMAGSVSKIYGVEEICSKYEVKVTYDIKEGQEFRAHQYLLTFTFVEESTEEMCDIIANINKCVRVMDDKGENIVIYFNDYKTIYQMQDNNAKKIGRN